VDKRAFFNDTISKRTAGSSVQAVGKNLFAFSSQQARGEGAGAASPQAPEGSREPPADRLTHGRGQTACH